MLGIDSGWSDMDMADEPHPQGRNLVEMFQKYFWKYI